jgi:hypothetical protein
LNLTHLFTPAIAARRQCGDWLYCSSGDGQHEA